MARPPGSTANPGRCRPCSRSRAARRPRGDRAIRQPGTWGSALSSRSLRTRSSGPRGRARRPSRSETSSHIQPVEGDLRMTLHIRSSYRGAVESSGDPRRMRIRRARRAGGDRHLQPCRRSRVAAGRASRRAERRVHAPHLLRPAAPRTRRWPRRSRASAPSSWCSRASITSSRRSLRTAVRRTGESTCIPRYCHCSAAGHARR